MGKEFPSAPGGGCDRDVGATKLSRHELGLQLEIAKNTSWEIAAVVVENGR